MREKTKQKLWDILFAIMIPLLLLGFCGAMVMNRMEITVRPAPPKWKIVLVVFQFIVLVMTAVLFRLMPKKNAAKKGEFRHDKHRNVRHI